MLVMVSGQHDTNGVALCLLCPGGGMKEKKGQEELLMWYINSIELKSLWEHPTSNQIMFPLCVYIVPMCR